jgi:hypothetical protein
MSKRTTPTKLGLGLLVALTLSTVSMSAHAGCKWYDAKCLAKEAREKVEAAANAARALAEQQAAAARAEAERQAAAARAAAEKAAAIAKAKADAAAKLAADAKAAAEKAAAVAAAEAKKVAEAAAAAYEKRGLPMNATEALSAANKIQSTVAKGAQGAAVDAMKVSKTAVKAANAELKKAVELLNVKIPDFEQMLKDNGLKQVKSVLACAKKTALNIASLDANDTKALNRLLRSATDKTPFDANDSKDLTSLLQAVHGDINNTCMCPNARGYNGAALNLVLTVPIGPTVPPTLTQAVIGAGVRVSAYNKNNGKPVFLFDWGVGAMPQPDQVTLGWNIPTLGIEAKWIPGEVAATNAAFGFGLAASMPIATPLGLKSMTLDVGWTVPNAVYGFLDPDTFNSMLKEAAKGKVATLVDQIGKAVTGLEAMVTGCPAIAVGIATKVGTPIGPMMPAEFVPEMVPYLILTGTSPTWQ